MRYHVGLPDPRRTSHDGIVPALGDEARSSGGSIPTRRSNGNEKVLLVKPSRVIVLVLGVAALLVVAYAVGWSRPSQAQYVPVPDVTRQQVSTAQSTLKAGGLSSKVVTRSASGQSLPPGSVIGQQPAAGDSVPRGTVVTLVVLSG